MALLLPMLLQSATVPAQETNPPAQVVHRFARHYKRQSLEERFKLLAGYLDLDQGQRTAIKNILLQRQQEIFKMRHSPSQSEGLQIDRFRAIEDKTVDKIRAMLTEEQRTKYDPLGVRNSKSASQKVSAENWLKEIGPR